MRSILTASGLLQMQVWILEGNKTAEQQAKHGSILMKVPNLHNIVRQTYDNVTTYQRFMTNL